MILIILHGKLMLMNLRSKIKFIFLAFFLIGLVTGCVYLRFLKVKNQMADFNKNFEITEENGLSLNFLNPVLKKKRYGLVNGDRAYY